MKWFWGALLIVIGVVMLGGNFGYWTDINWSRIFDFWPLILVIWGASLIVKPLPGGQIISIIIALLAVVFIYDVVISPNPIIKLNSLSSNQSGELTTLSEDLPADTTNAKISIDSGAADITVKGGSDKLITGTVGGGFINPNLDVKQSGQTVTAQFSSDRASWPHHFGQRSIDLSLNKSIPIALNIESGAASLDLDLRDMILSGASIEAGASSLDLQIGESIQNGSNVVINAGASSIDISVPKSLGVKVITDAGLSSKSFDQFTRDGSTYLSEGYEASSTKIVITIKAGVSSIDVSRD